MWNFKVAILGFREVFSAFLNFKVVACVLCGAHLTNDASLFVSFDKVPSETPPDIPELLDVVTASSMVSCASVVSVWNKIVQTKTGKECMTLHFRHELCVTKPRESLMVYSISPRSIRPKQSYELTIRRVAFSFMKNYLLLSPVSDVLRSVY